MNLGLVAGTGKTEKMLCEAIQAALSGQAVGIVCTADFVPVCTNYLDENEVLYSLKPLENGGFLIRMGAQ